jgi:hypothetical protein
MELILAQAGSTGRPGAHAALVTGTAAHRSGMDRAVIGA